MVDGHIVAPGPHISQPSAPQESETSGGVTLEQTQLPLEQPAEAPVSLQVTPLFEQPVLVPMAPHRSVSVSGSMQAPAGPHGSCPTGHWQTDPSQIRPGPTVAQTEVPESTQAPVPSAVDPQCAGSVRVSTHEPPTKH